MNPKQQKRMEQILSAMDVGVVKTEELKSVFDLVVTMFKEMRVYLQSEMTKGDDSNSQMCKNMMSDMSAMESKIMKMIEKSATSAEMDKALKGVMATINEIKQSMPTMPDLSVYEGKLEAIRLSIPVIKDTILDDGIAIRNKLENITPEKEKLSIEAISELRKELDEMKRNIMSRPRGISFFGGGRGGGRIVKSFDLSSQLNGVLRTFITPAMWRPISIHLSSFPSILREDVDYTWTEKSITMTAEVPDLALSTGQTLVLVYSEV